MSNTKARITRLALLLRKSPERQFNGEDYQAVAYDLAPADCTEDERLELESAPDPGCDCGFCASAPWVD